MAEEQIFISVPVEISNVYRKHWRQLCLARQRHPIEMRTSVEKDAGFQFRGFDDFRFLIARPENLPDRSLAKRLVRGEVACQFGKTRSEPESVSHRKPISPVPPGFDQLDRSVGVPIVVKEAQGDVRNSGFRRLNLPIQFINRVASPVADRQVQSSIAVEITRGDARPPSRPPRESPRSRHFLKVSVLISKDPHRAPFDGQREIGMTIAVQVREGDAAHQAKRFKWFAE